MTNNQRAPQSVCWHEGMLLSPQHFQQNHIYWETQLQWLTLNIGQYRWGVIEMAVDEARLVDGVVYLTRLRAVMPDGLQIDYDARFDPVLQLALGDNKELSENDRVKIQLTVPIRVPGSASDTTDIQRFTVCDGQPVKDDNTGEGEMVLQRLQPILSLQATEQVKAQYISLPLFEVCQPDGGHFKIGDYCPPVLGIGADTFMQQGEAASQRKSLQQRIQSAALAARKKARLLAGYSEQDDTQLGNRVSEKHRLWITAIVSNLPELELLSDNPDSAPWDVYQLMARVIGAMSVLDANGIPPKLPVYDHLNINRGFSQGLKYINALLDVVNLSYTSLVFDQNANGQFTIHYDENWGSRDMLVELKPLEGVSELELVQWFKACRIASTPLHNDLATSRLLGAEREQVLFKDEDTGITPTPGNPLFRIKVDPELIKPEQTLMLICTSGKLSKLQPKRIVLHLPHE